MKDLPVVMACEEVSGMGRATFLLCLWVVVASSLPALPVRAQGAAAAPLSPDDPRLAQRIFHMPYETSRLRWDSDLDDTLSLLPRIKASGYTAIAIGNSNEFAFPSHAWPGYEDKLRAVAEEAHGLGLGVIPMVTNFGNGQALINRDPSLVEPIPVRDTLFVVHDGVARLQPDQPVVVANPGFESAIEGRPVAWNDPESVSPQAAGIDSEISHGGERSLRFDLSGITEAHGWARLSQEVELTPFRLYRASVWIRTEDLRSRNVGSLQLWAGDRQLHYWEATVEPTQDWKRYTIVFNSLDRDRAKLRVDASSRSGQGRVWFDDIAIEEIGMLNIVRREGCPLVVRGQDGTIYEEGVDFEPVADQKLWAQNPWGGWSLTHEPPALKLTANSRMGDGERLRVSFYSVVPVYGQQTSACLTHPRCYELFLEGTGEIAGLVHPQGYHISLGEHRTANWCELCQQRGMIPAELIAESVQKRIEMVRELTPGASLYAWSDMLDPYHNAQDNYYYCNGSTIGAIDDISREIVILNWNYAGHEGRSPRYFAQHGFTQMLVGADGEVIARFLREMPNIDGIVGVYMYYSQEPEGFAAALWGG